MMAGRVISAPRSISGLCVALEGVAAQLALPGRPKGAGSIPGTAAHVGANGEEKTPWAALSADLLRMALSELPNHRGGPFDSRDDWVAMGHAVKGASVAGGIEAEGRDAFESWSDDWGGDPDAAGRFWDTCGVPHVGWGTIMQTLERVNPAGWVRVRDAVGKAAFAQQGATLSPIGSIAPPISPPRRWLYGRTVIAPFIAFLVAPGGAGKSALVMVEAVAMASGLELLPGEKPVRALRVWLHNAEDDLDEMHRRLAAVLKHYGLRYADLNGNLILSSGRDLKLQLARTAKNGPEIVPGVVDGIVEKAMSLGVDVLVLDPSGALHTLPENSNEAANLILGALRDIAQRADIAVVILHHAGKQAATDMDGAGAGASRGASAFVDGARVVRQLVRMTDKEAAKFGIAETDRRNYLRVENGKANLAPAENARWLRMVDVPLGNGAGLWPHGDRVGVVERWTPPTAQPGTASDLALVQAAITSASVLPRFDQRSPDWVGWWQMRWGWTQGRTCQRRTGPPNKPQL